MENFFSVGKLEAGCDEAGRGCLAGPVFAAAVILGNDFDNQHVNDSKQISEKMRNELRSYIQTHSLAWSVAYVEPKKIDEINILNASILAMHLALENLNITPEFILVDGNRFKPFKEISHLCMIKGDERFLNIAAASILAKTYRDDYMQELHQEFPHYKWNKNKGYATLDHRNAIIEAGITVHHRQSFRLMPEKQLILEF